MFNKPDSSEQPHAGPMGARDAGAEPHAPGRSGQTLVSLIANDMTLEGNFTGGRELQIDGAVKGDVRVERVSVSEGGQVDGSITAEAVEAARPRRAADHRQSRCAFHGGAHVDGDIAHEQLVMDDGAFFQGRSLRLQRPAAPAPSVPAARPAEPAARASVPGPAPKAAPPH